MEIFHVFVRFLYKHREWLLQFVQFMLGHVCRIYIVVHVAMYLCVCVLCVCVDFDYFFFLVIVCHSRDMYVGREEQTHIHTKRKKKQHSNRRNIFFWGAAFGQHYYMTSVLKRT